MRNSSTIQDNFQSNWRGLASRYLCLHMPFWSTGILECGWCAHLHHVPLVLYSSASGAGQNHIIRFCRCAQEAGIRYGMNVTTGTALAPRARTLPFDDYRDYRSLYKVAVWAIRFSPLVALDTELNDAFRSRTLHTLMPHYTGITLDITGTERIHGSESRLTNDIVKRFARRHMDVRIAIAPTIGAAWALSRFGDRSVSIIHEHEELRRALYPLPVQALRLEEQSCSILSQLGLSRIEQLIHLPRSQIIARFPHLLLRLDQVFGHRSEALSFIHPHEPFHASLQLEVPITAQEPLFRIIFELLQRVTTQLLARGRKAKSFLVELVKLDHERMPCVLRKEFTLFASTNNYSHARALMLPFLESIHAPYGICAIHIRAHVQRNDDEQPNCPAPDLMNYLTTRLGRKNVVKVQWHASHLPERSFSYRSLSDSAPADTVGSEMPLAHRPSYLLPEPEPITAIALLPDKAPSWVQWRGKKLRVAQGYGPERIGSEWWHHSVRLGEEPHARDYFKVEDESGRWLWIFRNQHSMRWYAHGVWL